MYGTSEPAASAVRAHVEVSPEMTTLLGDGPLTGVPLPPEPMTITFEWAAGAVSPRVTLSVVPDLSPRAALPLLQRIVLVVQASAFARLGGDLLLPRRAYHAPSELLTIALALAQSTETGETLKVYRLAKSIELLCQTLRLERERQLIPLGGDGSLSPADTRRILDARRMIDERWAERLTLERIARECGLNRAKLTARFRDVFKCTVAEAIAEKRLGEARRMLLTTDLPVASVGYRSGYLNNAAFSRAFSRRFGVTPSSLRSEGLPA